MARTLKVAIAGLGPVGQAGARGVHLPVSVFCTGLPEISPRNDIPNGHGQQEHRKMQHVSYTDMPHWRMFTSSKNLHAIEEPEDVRKTGEEPTGYKA